MVFSETVIQLKPLAMMVFVFCDEVNKVITCFNDLSLCDPGGRWTLLWGDSFSAFGPSLRGFRVQSLAQGHFGM